MSRRRRRCSWLISSRLSSVCLLSLLHSSSATSSSSSAASSVPVLGHDRDWWLDRVLLGESFSFDGSHSDFAQQFFRLFLDANTPVPDAVASGQLDSAHNDAVTERIRKAIASSSTSSDDISSRTLAFGDMSPLLQRAVLWDLGIVKAGDVTYTQVRTQCGLRMGELAVSKVNYEKVGCTAQACSTATGELYYQSLQCNGYQMGNASRCAAASGKSPVHASMWSNGGEEWALPDSFVAKHEWSDAGTNYVIYGIHLADDPNSYGKCVAPSITVPCIAYEQLNTTEQSAWCIPAPSRLVTQWIRAEHVVAVARTAAGKKTPPLEIILSSVFAAVVLLVGVWWIMKRRRERRRNVGGNKNERESIESEDHGGDNGMVSYFFTEDEYGNKRRGMGRDPHAMAVLGGGISFEKARSFGASAREGRRLRDDNASFGQQRNSNDLVHSEIIAGCGAVLAGSSVYGGSIHQMSRGRKASSAKGESGVYPLHEDDSPICASNTSTDMSSNGDFSSEACAWSPVQLDSTTASQYPSSTSSSGSSTRAPSSKSNDSVGVLSELFNDPRVMAKRIAYLDVSVSRQLSKGAFGEVWVGRMRDKLVAVKRLVPERRTSLKDLTTFIAEIRLMAQFEHRNVMSLLGVAWNSPPNLCMMMEFLDNGDLKDLLRAHSPTELTWRSPPCGTRQQDDETDAINPAGKKTSIAIDVASALCYLHGMTPPVVHRDLKSHNILLTSDLVAKLCDFGVSRVNEGVDTMTCGVGTAYWTAPEVLVGDKYTETADVYSFGVVLTELDTHQLPFHNLVDESGERVEPIIIMQRVCVGDISPSLTPECPSIIRELARDCMQLEPSSRPTLEDIINRLRKLSREEEGPGSIRALPILQSADSSSSNDPSGEWRNRMSSGFSISDDDRDTYFSSRRLLNNTFESSGSKKSPRDSDFDENGAVWI